MRRSLLFLAAAAALAACSADRTAILVEVTSPDLAVPADVDGLRFEAVSEYGGRVDQSFAITGQWPHSLTIVPPEGERMGGITITVTALRGGELVVRRVVTSTFVAGTTRPVTVSLAADCRGVVCEDGIDCLAGMCVGTTPDAGTGDAGTDDAGTDDAGTIDAGMIDAGMIDAGMIDAGRDAGMPDAGRDSGSPGIVVLTINEIDYDQPSTDMEEFVEIFNAGPTAVDLASYDLVLINGSSTPGTPYTTVALSGTLGPGQFLVVATAGVTGVPASALRVTLTPDTNAIQNGGTSPDGVAVWDRVRAELIDGLSYSGSAPITMATIGGRTVSLVSGTPTSAVDSTTAVRSVCRVPDGADSGDDAADWGTCGVVTPGAANVR